LDKRGNHHSKSFQKVAYNQVLKFNPRSINPKRIELRDQQQLYITEKEICVHEYSGYTERETLETCGFLIVGTPATGSNGVIPVHLVQKFNYGKRDGSLVQTNIGTFELEAVSHPYVGIRHFEDEAEEDDTMDYFNGKQDTLADRRGGFRVNCFAARSFDVHFPPLGNKKPDKSSKENTPL